ncbi:MFS transporter [Micrococcaceae bacterium Sec7.4]
MAILPTPTGSIANGAAPASSERSGTTFQGILLLIGSCLPVLGAVLLAPSLPNLMQVFAATPGVAVLVPMILTVPALMVAIVAPMAGAVADKVGRKQVLVVAMIAYAVLGVAPFFMDSLEAIVVTRVGVGICEGFIMTCCTTLLGDYYSAQRRNKYLSLQTVVTTISATVFLAAGGALGSLSWRAPFWLYAISIVIAVPMMFVLWEPVKQPTKHLRQAVPWSLIIRPALVTLLGGIVFYTLVVHLSFLLAGQGLTDIGGIGMMAALASLATAVGAFSFRAVGKFGPHRLMPVAFGLTAVGFIVIWFAGSVPAVMTGAVLASAGAGLLLPTLLTWAVNLLALEVRGTGTGIWTSALWIGQFVSPFIIAALGAAAGGMQAAVGILGIAAAVAAVLSIFVPGKSQRTATAAPSALVH